MKKSRSGFISFDSNDLDPDVSGAIGEGRKRSAFRGKTPAQRRKAEKDSQRNRRMIDLPEELEEHLESLAGELGVPVSSLISWLLVRSLDLVSLEELEAARELTRSMRFEYILPYKKGKGKHG